MRTPFHIFLKWGFPTASTSEVSGSLKASPLDRQVRNLTEIGQVTPEMIEAGKRAIRTWGEEAATCDHFLGEMLVEAFQAMEAVRQTHQDAAKYHKRTCQVSKDHLLPSDGVS